MISKKDGGAAFPKSSGVYGNNGMSLRDWFAGQAPPMPYQFRNDSIADNPKEPLAETISTWNYVYADAMIAERDK